MGEKYGGMDFETMKKMKLEYIEDVTARADEIQKEVLADILSKNARVEYLTRFGLDGRTDRESFKKVVPVINYADILKDINRIADGDRSSILCSEPISQFFLSSGTSSGETKIIPATETDDKLRSMCISLVMPVMSQFVAELDRKKGLYFLLTNADVATPGGLTAGFGLSSYLKNLRSHERPYDYYTDITSPPDTILCKDRYQSMYSQMLCGLYQNREVIRVGAPFATGIIRAVQFLQGHWSLLCRDIRIGSLDSTVDSISVRDAVLGILKPDPDLADFVEAECTKGSWQGIIKRLWPNANHIEATTTGTMSHYIPVIDYYSGGLPVANLTYRCSECFAGVNLNPFSELTETAYTLIPSIGFFEFLPVKSKYDPLGSSVGTEEEQQELVDLVDVKQGQEYELVVTTYAGLYRYRVGDVFRVAGFKNKAPQFNYIGRKNALLAIDQESTEESELHHAVKRAASNLVPFDIHVVDYTSYGDVTSTIPGHYVVYWELNQKGFGSVPSSVMEQCCLAIEDSLNKEYRERRVFGYIGPLEIKIVESGTFDKLMEYAINSGRSILQYKTPRCVKGESILEILNGRVVNNYFSPKCPKWTTCPEQWIQHEH